MSKEANGTNNPSHEVALVGDGPQGSSEISLQVLQSIYNEITGKTERLTRLFDRSFCFTYDDVEQLYYKLKQTCEQYNVQAQNENIKIYHEDDSHESFSSFERFRIYNRSATKPVESVLIKFNFLTVPPKVQKAQSYVVTVRLVSRLAVMRKIKRETQDLPRRLLHLFGGPTATVEVEYIDYIVARTFLGTIEGWLDSVHETKTPRYMKVLKRFSGLIPKLARYLLGILTAILVALKAPGFIDLGDQEILTEWYFSFWALIALFTAYRIGDLLGKVVSNSLADWQNIAYINMNRGDEKLLAEAMTDNKKLFLKIAISLTGALLTGIAASLIAAFLEPILSAF